MNRDLFYDRDRGVWRSPYITEKSGWKCLKQTVPQKLYLCRTFKPEEKTEDKPEESLKSLKAVSPTDYFPPDILRELLIENTLKALDLIKRSKCYNRLAFIPFGDSILLAHPCGSDGGRRLCFSRLTPWFADTELDLSGLNSRFQCLPRDYLEWLCGFSPVRHMILNPIGHVLYAMNDECVNIFDVDPAFEDPSFLLKFACPTPSPLVDICEIGEAGLVLLSENGAVHVWKDGETVCVCEDSGYQRLCKHPLGSPFHFISATDSRVSMFDTRNPTAPLELCTGTNISCIQAIQGESIFAVADDNVLRIFDLKSIRRPLLEWSSYIQFSGPVHRVRPFTWDSTLWLSCSTDKAVYLIPMTHEGDTWSAVLMPKRIALPLDTDIAGFDVGFFDTWTAATFVLRNDSTVLYNVSVPSNDDAIESEWDSIKGRVTPDYSQTFELESSLVRSSNFSAQRTCFKYHDYSFIWNWLWYGRATGPSRVVPAVDISYAFGLGSFVTEEILSALGEAQDNATTIDDTELRFSDPAEILRSRWGVN